MALSAARWSAWPRLRPALAGVVLLLVACDRRQEAAPSAAASATATTAAPSTATAATSASPASSAAPSRPMVAGPQSAEDRRFLDDLNGFCVITQQVKGDASIQPKDRAMSIVEKLVARKPSPAFLDLLRSMSSRPEGERYGALKEAATSHGASAWSCPDLDN
jgi:hypothetical protein